MAQAEYDKLAQGLSHDDYLVQVGTYQASRRALDLVDTLLEKARQLDDRAKSAQQHERDHRKLIAYASPHWKSAVEGGS